MAGTMKKKQTIAEVSKETLLLESYLAKKKAGEELSYNKIETDTGVTMDETGKGKLRSALRRAKLEASTIKGYGIKLADVSSAMEIVTHRLNKIDRAVKRGEKTHKTIQEQFFSSLPPDEQKEILYLGAVFGAIRVASDNGKMVYSRKKELTNTISIPVPRF